MWILNGNTFVSTESSALSRSTYSLYLYLLDHLQILYLITIITIMITIVL